MKDMDMGLWKNIDFLPAGHVDFGFDATSLGAAALMKDVLTKSSGHLSTFARAGNVKQSAASEDDVPMSIRDKCIKLMTDLGGRLVYRDVSRGGGLFVWENGMVSMDISGVYVNIEAVSQDEVLVNKIREEFAPQWAIVETTGHIYAIVSSNGRLSMSSIGNAGISLEAGNYTPKVMKDYKFMVKDLCSETPSGRISIMRGVAGTGKTHLIRALLLEVPDALFVLVSPDLATNLPGPELLPLLMQYHANTSGPIVLVIEDADKCLVSRGESNMNSVQSLLNLGDGILGSLLDIRIVATTNADEFKMDAAITRPGRLSKMLDVGVLDYETACSVFKRLLPDLALPKDLDIGYDAGMLEVHPSHSGVHYMGARAALTKEAHKRIADFKMTLAEVYALARKNGWTAASRKAEKPEPEEDEDLEDEALEDEASWY